MHPAGASGSRRATQVYTGANTGRKCVRPTVGGCVVTRVLTGLVVCACTVVVAAPSDDLATQAAAARDANNIPRALQLYRQGVEQQPAWLDGWWFLGLLSYETAEFGEGRRAFTEFTRLQPKSPMAWAFLGLCEYEIGEYTSALEHLERSLGPGGGLHPDLEPVARFHHALLLTRAGSFDRARLMFQPFVRRAIQDPVLIAGLGLNALRRPLTPKEVPAAEEKLILAAGDALYAWLAGDMSKAETSFRSLLETYSGVPGVHYLYATYLLVTRPDDVKAELGREFTVSPRSADARALLALLLVQEGDTSSALPVAKAAAEDAPTSATAQYAYGVALKLAGEVSLAIPRLEAALRIDPAKAEYHMTLAGAYSKAGRYEDALRERRTSIELAREASGPG